MMCYDDHLPCMNILAFSAKRSMYNSQVKNDLAVDICPILVKRSRDHGSRLLCVAIEFCPTRNEETVNVHGLKTLPSLPRTIEPATMLHQLPCMKRLISKDPTGFPVNRIPLPVKEKIRRNDSHISKSYGRMHQMVLITWSCDAENSESNGTGITFDMPSRTALTCSSNSCNR